jgi:hypothetical protein
LQSDGDPLGDITLDREDIGQVAVVGLGPQMDVRARFYQLGRDAHLSASAPDTSFKNIGNPQLLSDLTKIPMRTGHITRDARPRDHLKLGEFGERGENVFLHPLGEKSILLVGAEIREGQHGNAFFGNGNL